MVEDFDPTTHAAPHFLWSEFACVNDLARPFVEGGRTCLAGDLVMPYPLDYREPRGRRLARVLEAVRALHHLPLVLTSVYRTPAYNLAVHGARSSMHLAGLAADVRVPTGVDLGYWHREIRERAIAGVGEFAAIGGLGRGQTFLHIDLRQRANGRLAEWTY